MEESQIRVLSHGNEVDLSKSILESGISYDDEVSIVILPKEEPVNSTVLFFTIY